MKVNFNVNGIIVSIERDSLVNVGINTEFIIDSVFKEMFELSAKDAYRSRLQPTYIQVTGKGGCEEKIEFTEELFLEMNHVDVGDTLYVVGKKETFGGEEITLKMSRFPLPKEKTTVISKRGGGGRGDDFGVGFVMGAVLF